MAVSTTITVHGGSIAYTGEPQIYMDFAASDVTRSGNTISCTITNASVQALTGSSYFGYDLTVYARLDSGTMVQLWTKPASDSQWSAGTYNISSNVTVTATNTTTSATLSVLVYSSTCPCSEVGTTAVVWSRTVSAPASTVTVTFDPNGGTRTGGGALVQTIEVGGTATEPTLTRDNCIFAGWDRSLSNITSDTTITAIWNYIVSYDTSDLGVYLEDQTKIHGTALTLHSYDLSSENPGYTHSGWATTSGGSARYSLGGSYTTNSPITLYPAWGTSTETFTVTFDLNGGTSSGGGALTQTVRYGNSATPPNDPVKEGRRFVGWLGDYTNVTSDRTIIALYDASPLWIFTGTEWIPFSS